MKQMLDIVKKYDNQPVTEIHIVGGVHPKMNLEFFVQLLRNIKSHRPDLHIKGFTAVELDYMFRKAKLSIGEGLRQMYEAGLDSLPGGGAEIFHPLIREQICGDKVSAEGWLQIHETAHSLGMHQRLLVPSSPAVVRSNGFVYPAMISFVFLEFGDAALLYVSQY